MRFYLCNARLFHESRLNAPSTFAVDADQIDAVETAVDDDRISVTMADGTTYRAEMLTTDESVAQEYRDAD